MSDLPHCANCATVLGRLETPLLVNGQRVCAKCSKVLEQQKFKTADGAWTNAGFQRFFTRFTFVASLLSFACGIYFMKHSREGSPNASMGGYLTFFGFVGMVLCRPLGWIFYKFNEREFNAGKKHDA